MENLQKVEFHATEAQKIAEVSGMKEILWQAHHMVGKFYLKKKRLSFARKELRKAEQIVDAISSNLSKELRRTYLGKKEIEELRKDLKSIKSKPERGKRYEKFWPRS